MVPAPATGTSSPPVVSIHTLLDFVNSPKSLMSQDTDLEVPLQIRLNKITTSIEKLGSALAFLVHVVLLIRYFMGNTEDENGKRQFNGRRTKEDTIINFVTGIVSALVTIVVVAILEGLHLAVTLTLTLGYFMNRMMDDQAVVRKLSACEIMASATTICTDKTGTLTMNKMKVAKFWLGNDSFEGGLNMGRCLVEMLREGVGLNTTGGVHMSAKGVEFSGSPTEKAILSWAVMEMGMDMKEVKRSCEILQF